MKTDINLSGTQQKRAAKHLPSATMTLFHHGKLCNVTQLPNTPTNSQLHCQLCFTIKIYIFVPKISLALNLNPLAHSRHSKNVSFY